MMERFGRHEIDAIASRDNGYTVFLETQAPLVDVATRDPEEFVRALAEACVPVGGWAIYGAERTVIKLVGPTVDGEDWYSILDGSIEFLRSNYVPTDRLPAYLWARFLEQGGTEDSWLSLRPPPDRGAVEITPLRRGETRRLVKFSPEWNSKVILLQRQGDQYVALIDGLAGEVGADRARSEWKRGSDLYQLYLDIAWSAQVWDWADPEIEPFFPAPKARI